MISNFGVAAIGHLCLFIALFFWGSAMAARAAGRSIWLFDKSKGHEKLAIIGFRLAFTLPILCLLLFQFAPEMAKYDPLMSYSSLFLGFTGQFIAATGVAISFAAQMAMGASWRVGVVEGETGPLVSEGLFAYSRNPTFLGHLILLIGVAIAVPSIVTLLAAILYGVLAKYQALQEEAVLLKTLGKEYSSYMRQTPRWFGLPENTDI